MPKSVELLKSDKSRDFLACIDKSVYKMSDFEIFAFVCKNPFLMVGSDLLLNFISCLREEVGENLDIYRLWDTEVQKKLWRRIHGDNVVVFEGSVHTLDVPSLIDNSTPLVLNSLFEKRDALPDDVDRMCAGIDQAIAIDISELSYQRPDEYHAGLTYKKILRGEPYGKDEFCALLCFVLCRVLMKKTVDVYIIADKNLIETTKLLALFENRKLYPHVHICTELKTKDTVISIADICLKSEQKNISPCIVIHEEITENLKKLISLIPSARISLCGFLTDEAGKALFENTLNSMAQEI